MTIIPTDTEKALTKFQHPFICKSLNKLGIEENVLNLINCDFQKNLQLILYLLVKENVFNLRLEKRQEYLFSPLLLNIALEISTNIIRKGKDIKVIHIGKEEVKLFLFTGMIFL